MTKSRAILAVPLIIALLGLVFCIWSALGNSVNFCVTTGCTLYQDFTIADISLWWFGAVAFACLAISALLGQAAVGRWFGALFLIGDICLLILMMVTAPCVSCLVAALLFALCYCFFRRCHMAATMKPGHNPLFRRSLLIPVWCVFFIVNLGQVARSQLDIWPMLNESGNPTIRMFFSPTCRFCVAGVEALSGNVNVAWYPVADSPDDVARVHKMVSLLGQGLSIAEALNQSRDAAFTGIWQSVRPDILLLRFHMLCNKAHVFTQGSQGVPFLEFKGLPSGLIESTEPPRFAPNEDLEPTPPSTGDPSLPRELLSGGQCGGAVPCPPPEQTLRP